MKKMLLPILLSALIPFFTNAQTNVSKLLKDIKCKVDEIVIKSEGKEYKFVGDEAEKLFATMKQDKKMKHFEFFTDDGKMITRDSLNKKISIEYLNDEDSDSDVLVFINENDDSDTLSNNIEKVEKRVIVTNDDGKKVVTVTTKENGKENIEVFDGKAAEEYLEKMKSEKEFDFKVDVDKDSKHKKIKKIIIEKKEDTE
jgi:hypothetical protein